VNEDEFTFFVIHRFSRKEKKWRIARLKKDGKCKEELESHEKQHNCLGGHRSKLSKFPLGSPPGWIDKDFVIW
jgi:hypothetical protein